MRAAMLVLIAGCFDPSPTAGAPCGANDTCPAPLVCTLGRCVPPGTAPDDAPIDALAWASPVPLSALNTPDRDSDPAITADGLELFFSSSRQGMGRDDIYLATRASSASPWEPPIHLAVIASSSSDLSVEITGDGRQLWFQSSRSGMGDIYTSTRDQLGMWSAPALVAEVSSPTEIEADLGVAPDGLSMIIARGELGSRVLHLATRPSLSAAWSTPAPLAALNNAADDPSAPSLSNGASIVYFHADPTRNIYVATKTGNSYTAPVPVSEVNTDLRDACPYAPQSNDVLYFERAGDLYVTTR
ncbi:MAG: TolB family protein [Kofleriaceae bacterium]